MNTEFLSQAVQAYPGVAFAAGASIIWGARYILKIRAELENIQTEQHRGEQAALTKILDMNDFLDSVASEERSQVDGVEHELVQRQLATLNQKGTLSGAYDVMSSSIHAKEEFHNQLLDRFEELEESFNGFGELDEIHRILNPMKEAFEQLTATQQTLVDRNAVLAHKLRDTEEIAKTLVREVGA